MALENEIRLGQRKLEFLLKWSCVAAAIFFCAFCLPGCVDADLEQKIADAERNAEVARMCLPASDELVTVKRKGDKFEFHRYSYTPRRIGSSYTLAISEGK